MTTRQLIRIPSAMALMLVAALGRLPSGLAVQEEMLPKGYPEPTDDPTSSKRRRSKGDRKRNRQERYR